MKKLLLLFGFCLWLGALAAQAPSAKTKTTISQIMHRQTEAWNKGDIDQFMVGYWEHDSLRFIGSKGVTYGYQPTLANYKKGYPDKATMGKLAFSDLRMQQLSKKVVLVIGKWFLARSPEKEDIGGHYSLVWKKIKGKWVIVADHSS